MELSLQNLIDGHFDYALARMGELATVNGQDGIPCIFTPRTRGRNNDLYGDIPTASASMFCRTSGFASATSPGDPVVFKGRSYRIAQIQQNPCGRVQVFVLEDING